MSQGPACASITTVVQQNFGQVIWLIGLVETFKSIHRCPLQLFFMRLKSVFSSIEVPPSSTRGCGLEFRVYVGSYQKLGVPFWGSL